MFTLGRKIDFNYKTNKIIAILSILLAIIGWILSGEVFSGLYTGGGIFLTWALSRELDPKHDYSAFIAAGFSILNVFYFEDIQLLVIFWLLLLMRIVNGITGKELTCFDISSVLGLTIYISLNSKNSVYLLIFIIAMAFIIKEKRIEALIASVISFLLFIAESYFMRYLSLSNIDFSDFISILTMN